MASQTLLPLLLLLPFLFAVAADVAQGPTTPAPEHNLTSILEEGEQFTTLLRLLNTTRVNDQLSGQLRDSYDGLTFFAPTDSAFAKLKVGTLNGLTDQEQVQLVLYHVLPRYYSLATFQTASNPLRTEASGPGGAYSVNVTTSAATSSLVNVSTGVVAVPVSNTLLAEFPLAVYAVDDVLLPEQLFGSKSPDKQASAPAPGQQAAGKATARKKGATPKSDVAAEPSAAGTEEDDDAANAVAGRGRAEWSTVAALALVAVVNLVAA